jgi:hypothetical protein
MISEPVPHLSPPLKASSSHLIVKPRVDMILQLVVILVVAIVSAQLNTSFQLTFKPNSPAFDFFSDQRGM